MSKDTLLLVDALSNVKGLSPEIVFDAAEQGIREAIVTTFRKMHGTDLDLKVKIDRTSGEYVISRLWKVVDDGQVTNPASEIALSDAHKKYLNAKVGDELDEPMESIEFGRITSRTAKQYIMKKIREAEMSQIVDSYRQRVGELMSGVVQRVAREFVTVDLGNNVEGVFLREEMLPREAVRAGDRLRGYLYEVRSDGRSTQLLLSRTRPQMLTELFKIEVPEIAEQLIQVKSAARDPGVRAKIAVKTNDGRIDPIGACVGMRGSRVQAVSSELGGERIDIVLWDDNPAQMVINAMAPAEVASIVVDEDSHSIDVAVEEEQLSLAIGKNGQNVRLAGQLTGWTLNVMSKAQAEEKHKLEAQKVIQLFVDELGVDEDLAKMLVDHGFTTIEEIAYVAADELLAIDGFDEEIVEALQSRAKDILLTEAIASEERLVEGEPAEDLLTLEGMTEALAKQLAQNGVITREDLADQSVADLLDIVEDLDAAKAAELIMLARAPWFADEKK
ncbi:MAG: transcription termination factor NusA [Gammaproteobacteria bacterium]|nr:transcription termination factor NusA [Gammaproteobacteria bacterium]